MQVLVLAQYFPPDMGGGSTRASYVVKGLVSEGCDVTVVAAFPHYLHGKVLSQYRRKAIVSEKFGAAKVFRVWIPALAHSCPLKRVVLRFFNIYGPRQGMNDYGGVITRFVEPCRQSRRW